MNPGLLMDLLLVIYGNKSPRFNGNHPVNVNMIKYNVYTG